MLCILYDETLEQLLLSQEILILVFIKQQEVHAAGEQLQKSEIILSPSTLSHLCYINHYEGRGAWNVHLTSLFLSFLTHFFKHIYVIHKKPDTQEP